MKTGSDKICRAEDSLTSTAPLTNVERYTFDMPLRLIGDDPSYDPAGYVSFDGTNKLETIYISVTAW